MRLVINTDPFSHRFCATHMRKSLEVFHISVSSLQAKQQRCDRRGVPGSHCVLSQGNFLTLLSSLGSGEVSPRKQRLMLHRYHSYSYGKNNNFTMSKSFLMQKIIFIY